MNEWAWMILGLALAATELAIIDSSFYLIFAGAAAFVISGILAAGIELDTGGQWAGFAALCLMLLAGFPSRLHERFVRRTTSDRKDWPVGEVTAVGSQLSSGQTGRAEMGGTEWAVHNIGGNEIGKGEEAIVIGKRGNTLDVEGAGR